MINYSNSNSRMSHSCWLMERDYNSWLIDWVIVINIYLVSYYILSSQYYNLIIVDIIQSSTTTSLNCYKDLHYHN
mgnify:CR=1 FL=1